MQIIETENLTKYYGKTPVVDSLSLSVPEGSVYVLGDYRTNTQDSRDFGAIPIKSVQGKVITILRRRGL